MVMMIGMRFIDVAPSNPLLYSNPHGEARFSQNLPLGNYF